MNQQDMILPFCKSVKFLYSGVKKLYSRGNNQPLHLQYINPTIQSGNLLPLGDSMSSAKILICFLRKAIFLVICFLQKAILL